MLIPGIGSASEMFRISHFDQSCMLLFSVKLPRMILSKAEQDVQDFDYELYGSPYRDTKPPQLTPESQK